MSFDQLNGRITRLEARFAGPEGVDRRELAGACQRLIDRVDQLATTHGISPAGVPGQLDRALEQVQAARRRARSRS